MTSEITIAPKVEAGRPRGSIHFGLGLDSCFPEGYAVNVNVGDMVVADTTILARKKSRL